MGLNETLEELKKEKEKHTQALGAHNTTTVRHTNTQPYETRVKTGIDVDSKGNLKPSCEITITRRLENGDQITELIQADIQRGIDETMHAVQDMLQRGKQHHEA
jgi:hypothetical protein